MLIEPLDYITSLCLYYFPVPDPTSVIVTNDPVSPIRPVGSDVTLNCNVELSPAVDVLVTVNTEWTGPAGFMTTNTAQPVMGSTTTYTSIAMVSSFGRDQSGNYRCTATASPNPSSMFHTGGGSRLEIVKVTCLLYTSPSPRDATLARMPSSA